MELVNITVEDAESDQDNDKNSHNEHEYYLPNVSTEASDNQTYEGGDLKMENKETKKDTEPKITDSRVKKNHPSEVMIGISEGRKTREKKRVDYREMVGIIGLACYTSIIKPKNAKKAIQDEY